MADVMDGVATETLDNRRLSPESSTPPPPLRRRDRGDDRDHNRDRSPQHPPTQPPSLPSSGPVHPRFDRDRDRDRDRERDRDFRRRGSPSPPPYRRRDRSPPRRSPLPAKRYRRNDGGYDRRRGSPRGGFGPDDRRYGYSYDEGYERDGPVRRHGYGDEWPPRPMSYQSGHGGYGDGNAGVTGREGLMSYKQFIQELEDDVLPSEAERRYEEYRSEYISTQKRAYFEAHKDEEWLKDKYHPTNLVQVIESGPGLTASSQSKSDQFSELVSEDEADNGGKRRRHRRGPAKENDLLADAPRTHPVSSEPRRIQIDIEQAQALVRKLDAEKGVEDNVLGGGDGDKSEGQKSHGGSMGPIIIIRGLATVKGLEGVELLDTLITYLWRIHGVDYYGMLETNEPKGLRHVRADAKSSDSPIESGADWEKKFDSFWQKRLHGQDPLEILAGKDKIDAASVEVLDPLVRKIRDEKYGWKYGCGAKGCTKLFHAPEFVNKHLRLKHAELVMELTVKVREDLYFQNYMNDPEAPGGKPIMRSSSQRDRPLRRRPLEGRLRDDRGNRREHDRTYREDDEDRYARGVKSPSNAQEESNFDELGGHGMHGPASFSPDIPPPPVLMPVPGAGPLGPFVPAPPEVAMRMLREQGGPPPFEPNGGPRGRKGRPGPPVGGPAPVLAVPPAFHQDPRRVRSYHDLDAPEDEVTVIDYRSL